MSVYHNSFTYLGINSLKDKNWIIAHFADSADSGESESYLTKDQVYTDSYDGTKRILYGSKYSTVATPVITVLKQDGSDFSLEDIRNAYKWLTGNTSSSWLDLYVGDEVKYRLLVTIQDVKPYKMDARTIGLNIYCESLSPWGYSPLQTVSEYLNGETEIKIDNLSDDLYTYTPVNIKFENTSGESLEIVNDTLGETTEIKVNENEIITLSDNMTIVSDNSKRIFGSDFNFVFPRLKSGINKFIVTGIGKITFEYIYCIKMGDMAITLNATSDPICNDEGQIVIDTLDWNRIINTPRTLSGYGIDNAYTKDEVDKKILNAQVSSVSWSNITHKPELYTKSEVDTLLSSIKVSIDETELNTMLSEVLG